MTGAMSLAGLDVPVNSLILSVVGAALLLAIVLAVTSKVSPLNPPHLDHGVVFLRDSFFFMPSVQKQSQDFPAPIVEYVADEVINKPLKYKVRR